MERLKLFAAKTAFPCQSWNVRKVEVRSSILGETCIFCRTGTLRLLIFYRLNEDGTYEEFTYQEICDICYARGPEMDNFSTNSASFTLKDLYRFIAQFVDTKVYEVDGHFYESGK